MKNCCCAWNAHCRLAMNTKRGRKREQLALCIARTCERKLYSEQYKKYNVSWGHHCSETALTGNPSFRSEVCTLGGAQTSAPCGGKLTFSPLDQLYCIVEREYRMLHSNTLFPLSPFNRSNALQCQKIRTVINIRQHFNASAELVPTTAVLSSVLKKTNTASKFPLPNHDCFSPCLTPNFPAVLESHCTLPHCLTVPLPTVTAPLLNSGTT
jgi:hypothetical protein